MHYLRYLRRQSTMVSNLQVQRTTNTHPLEPTQPTLPTLPRLQKRLGETTVCLEPTVPKPDNNIILSVALATTTARRIYCKDINVEVLKNEEHIVAMTPDWILY